jgi:hypothetical protein
VVEPVDGVLVLVVVVEAAAVSVFVVVVELLLELSVLLDDSDFFAPPELL